MNKLNTCAACAIIFIVMVSGHCHRVGKRGDAVARAAPSVRPTSIDTFNALLSQAKANSTATKAHFRAEMRALKAGRPAQKQTYKMERNPEGIWEYYPVNIHNQNIQK